MSFRQEHLLGIEPLAPDEITALLDRADEYVALSRSPDKHSEALTAVLLL